MSRVSKFVAILAVAILSSLALLLISPLLLIVPNELYGVDWNELSAVGQSYTGIAAIFSAGALVGVVYSIRLQVKQNDILRRQSVREMQARLLEFAMVDPVYASVLRQYRGSVDHDHYRQSIFRNLWFRYLEFGYLTGEISDNQLDLILVSEVFQDPAARQWWVEARPYWVQQGPTSTSDSEKFITIIESAFISTQPPDSDPESPNSA